MRRNGSLVSSSSEKRPPVAVEGDLAALGERLKRFRAEVEPPALKPVDQPTSGMGMAFAVAAHMVAGLAVGGGIGYMLDRWLDTSPWMLVLFFFLGSGAGILNTYRMASGMGMAMGYHPAPEAKRSERDAGSGAMASPGQTDKKGGGNQGGQSA